MGEWTAYDENGTAYEGSSMSPTITCGGKKVWSTNTIKFGHNASATFSLKIDNVPTSVSSFSMIRIPLINYDYGSWIGESKYNTMLIFRNLNITEAPKPTSVRNTTKVPAKKTNTSRTIRKTTKR